MLLTGTQILEWYWLLLLAVIGLAITGWRIQQRLVQRYEVARLIDDRLQLQDSLSTAWFLLGDSSAGDRPAARHQLRQAEQIASGIAPESAFPIMMSRLWIATLALLAIIFGLFAARYLVNSSLSLRPALIHLPFSSLKSATAKEKTTGDGRKTEAKGQPVRELLAGQQHDIRSQPADQPQMPPNTQTDSHSQQNANSTSSGKSSSQAQQQPEDGQSNSKEGSQSSQQAEANNSTGDSKPGQNSKQSNSSQQQDKGQSKPKTADGQQTPGLMDKMKDALSGLMAKLQRNSATDSTSKDSKTSNSANQKGDSQQNAANKKQQSGAPDQNGQKSESSLDSQSAAQAAAVEKTPASSIGSSNEAMPQSKTNDPQSGAGRQDGQKDLKPADQLKAMGKLAEIIGKRSANLTGEIKVDKPTGEQQLQTQYSNQVGHHADTGGEINRDEVPSEYQNYVRAYMKEVHKEANAAK